MGDLIKYLAVGYIGYIAGKRGVGAVLEESKALNQQVAQLIQKAAEASDSASGEPSMPSPYMTGLPRL